MSPGEQSVGQLLSEGGMRPDPAAGRVLRLGDPEELRDELALGRAVLPLGLGPDEVALRVPAQTWVAFLAYCKLEKSCRVALVARLG